MWYPVVKVWVFITRSPSPFHAIQLGRDVRGECSIKTMGIGNKISEKGVLPWSKVKKSEGEKFSLFWCTQSCFGTAFTSDVTSQLNNRERGRALDSKNPDPYYCVTIVIAYLKDGTCKCHISFPEIDFLPFIDSIQQSRRYYLEFFLLVFVQLSIFLDLLHRYKLFNWLIFRHIKSFFFNFGVKLCLFAFQ